MGFRQPQAATADQLTYTTAMPATVAVQPGSLRVNGSHTITRQRLQFKAAEGPAGGSFTARWLRNGVSLGTITVANAAVAGDIAAPANATLVDGDLLTFEVLGLSAAAGAVVGILDVTTP